MALLTLGLSPGGPQTFPARSEMGPSLSITNRRDAASIPRPHVLLEDGKGPCITTSHSQRDLAINVKTEGSQSPFLKGH